MMTNCSAENCDKEIADVIPFKCKYCGKIFCNEHRLPENHQCSFDNVPSKHKRSNFVRRTKPTKIKRLNPKNQTKFLKRNKWKIVIIIVCLFIIISMLDVNFLIFGPYTTVKTNEIIEFNNYNNLYEQTFTLNQSRERCVISFSATHLVSLYVFDDANFQKFQYNLYNGYGPDYSYLQHISYSLNGHTSITQWNIIPNKAEVNTYHLVIFGPLVNITYMTLTLTYRLNLSK